jgi:hypothetical protein
MDSTVVMTVFFPGSVPVKDVITFCVLSLMEWEEKTQERSLPELLLRH